MSDAPETALSLAHKLVGLANEQRNALDQDRREQYAWLVLRRQEVTRALESLFASGVQMPPPVSEVLMTLREELLSTDAAMEARLKAELRRVAALRRTFRRNRGALGSYLGTGAPRQGFFDTRH